MFKLLFYLWFFSDKISINTDMRLVEPTINLQLSYLNEICLYRFLFNGCDRVATTNASKLLINQSEERIFLTDQ